MLAYVKKYEEIEENGWVICNDVYTNSHRLDAPFTRFMKCFCNKGPFRFEIMRASKKGNWYKYQGFQWHISWLNPITENKQYLLEFK